MSISARIREAASLKSMNIKDFSDALGISYRTIQNYLAEERAVGSDFLAACSERLGVSATWILTGIGAPLLQGEHPNDVSGDHEFIPIQRYDVSAAAGSGSLIGAELGTGFYAFNRKWLDRRGLQTKNLAVIAVRGDSMEPDLHDKDLILLDRSQTAPADGDIYVLRYSGMLFVKRVQVIPGNRAELRSTNPLYGPIIVTMETAGDDLAFIGRVVASMHEW